MIKKLLIWGIGLRGEEAYRAVEMLRGYEVAAFSDNNKKFWGTKKFGKPVIEPQKILSFENLDGVLIAANAVEEIRMQLKNLTELPVYQSVNDLWIQQISIDISGFCNAKCKWCVTGRNNRQKAGRQQMLYMSYDQFVKIYEHLYKNFMIERDTEIMLYSWGEPFLNKDYIAIVEYLAEHRQRFVVSTNASKVQLSDMKHTYKSCSIFIFSVPGFSQESYNHIHGFDFEKIKKNIRRINDNIHETGFHGDASLSFHVYKFNEHEIVYAEEFAQSLGLNFHPYYPYFNGNSMMEQYLEGTLPEQMLTQAEEELYLTHVNALLSKRPQNYRCFLERIISIDYNGNLVLCCAADAGCEEYFWGSIFQVASYEELIKTREKMLGCSSCKKCRQLGIDYWLAYNPAYKKGE